MNQRRGRLLEAGQSSVEYLVGCLVVLALLLVDIPGGMPTLTLLTHAVRDAFARFAAALSIA